MSGGMTLLSNAFIDEIQPVNVTDISNCIQHKSNIFHCIMNESYHFWVQKVFPPVIEQETRLVVLALVFIVCFIVSLAGNVSVLTIVYGVIKNRSWSGARNGDHTIIYICALCITDIFISLSLPTAITDNLLGFWLFGRAICKVHHICGSVGRIVSTFLITAITFDRYAAVCHPLSSTFRTNSFVFSVIGGVVVIAVLLLLPLLIYADTREYIIHELVAYSGNITRVRVYKCTDAMPREIFYFFTYTTFTIGFLLPLSLIVYFDFNLLRRLHDHARHHPNTTIPLRRIFQYTVTITVVYFIGWTPYWWSVLYGSYLIRTGPLENGVMNDTNEVDGRFIIHLIYSLDSQKDKDSLFIIYVLHAFPYLAVASNWVFYGLLNTQLQCRVNGNNERSFIPSARSKLESPHESQAMLRAMKKSTDFDSTPL